jgi:uncharacterized protein with GYD domain
VPTLVVSALSTFDNKGLKKAKKEVSAFDKQIKSFAKVFATAFSVTALSKYSKAAVKAFMADEKAAKSLEQQLKNTGYQFSAPGVELYIANLQKSTGVLDDDLRPAFQRLLTVTGSITKSQDALSTALNVSAATGRSLGEVTTALSRGFAGNTTGLSRLGAGLSKTLLKTGDMNKIMEELNTKFAGQAAARLDTYAGKMDLLKVASANASETIGKSLLDALAALGDDNSIEGLSKNMEDFGTATAEVITGLGIVAERLKKLTTIPGIGNIFDVKNIPVLGGYIGGLQQLGRNAMPQQDRGGQERTAGRVNAQQVRIEDKLSKAKALELSTLLKKNAIENKNVEELKKKFDLERIGINAALNSATDEETKLRLKSQLAILDNNEALAKKLLAELEASEALKKLAEQARLAGMSIEDFGIMKVKALTTKIDTYVEDMALSMIRELNARIQSIIAKINMTMPTTTAPTAPASPYADYTVPQAIEKVRETNQRIQDMINEINRGGVQRSSSQSPMDIKITVDAGGDRLSQAIAESIQVATRSGYSTVPAGFLV